MLERHHSSSLASRHENGRNDRWDVLVVFVDHTDCRYLRWLKTGFKHCFVAMRKENHWIICDSLKNRLEFFAIDLPCDFSLGEFYRRRGHTVLVGASSGRLATTSFIPEVLTCVTVVKRILGIQSFWTITPWQLFSLLASKTDRWREIDETGR